LGPVDEETVKFISKVPLFKRLPKECLPQLASCAQRVSFQPGQDVIRQGESGEEFFVIMVGEAEVKIDNSKVATLKHRDFFGEVSLLRDEPRTATITALTNLLTIRITRTQFMQLGLNEKIQFPTRKAVAAGGKKPNAKTQQPSPKTPEERAGMVDALKSNKNLQELVGLQTNHMDALIDIAWKENVKDGTSIIVEGDADADFFYVIQEGSFEIFIKPKEEEEGQSLKAAEAATQSVGVVSKGQSFGELALIYSTPRAATVKAKGNCVVWVIDRTNFKTILEMAANEVTNQYVTYLQKVQILESLKDDEKVQLAKALTEIMFGRDELIFQQGDAGDCFYILVEGQVTVVQDGAVKATLASLPEKAVVFGELALLNNEPRQATIKVTSDSAKALYVDRKTFDMLLGPLEEIKKRGKTGAAEVKKADAGAAGKTQFGVIQRKNLTPLGLLGCGGFGAVELVEDQTTKETYALKSLSKGYVLQSGMQTSVISEKNVQLMCDSVFVVKLYETYNEPQKLLLLLELALGGELYATYERKGFHGKEAHAQFYVAGTTLAFAHLHERKIVFRDLKPENLLLNEKGQIKLTDMGLAKVTFGKTYTTCGTPDYFAPELIESKGHSHAVDWWCLGILTFELMGGRTPFEAASPMQICQKVKKGIAKATFPAKCKGVIETLIKGLCEQEPSKRLPMKKGGIDNIKKHAWFKGFDWDKMINLTLEAPYVPQVKSKTDIDNFSAQAEDMPPQVPYKDDGTGWDKDFATST